MKINKLSIVLCLLLCGSYIFFALVLFGVREDRVRLAQEIENSINKSAGQPTDDQVRQYFVKSGEEADFVSSIEAACAALSLDCQTQSVGESDPSTDGSSVQVLRVVMSAQGDFDSVMKFLERFELSPYPIDISSVDLSSSDKVWEGKFDVTAPVVPE